MAPEACDLDLVIKLAEQGHASLDPMVFGFVCRDEHPYDIVGGMACGGERSPTLTCLVDWNVIDSCLIEIFSLTRLDPDLKLKNRKNPKNLDTRKNCCNYPKILII